jgi:hypothetical protein
MFHYDFLTINFLKKCIRLGKGHAKKPQQQTSHDHSYNSSKPASPPVTRRPFLDQWLAQGKHYKLIALYCMYSQWGSETLFNII